MSIIEFENFPQDLTFWKNMLFHLVRTQNFGKRLNVISEIMTIFDYDEHCDKI